MRQKEWVKMNLKMKLTAAFLKAKRNPRMPKNPKTGKWYRMDLPGSTRSNGGSIHASLRIGSENKLMVFLHGGGVSWNEHMAARGFGITVPTDGEDGFYAVDSDLFTDLILRWGIASQGESCCFRNWYILNIPYCTGDLHCGTGDFPYTARDGSRQVLRHHGYTNYRAALEAAMAYIPSPEQIVVTGCSGGGFGAALLADDVLRSFPDCKDAVCYVDSGFILYDNWRQAAEQVWQAPKEIYSRVVSNNITLDVLKALKRDHGDRVKILFSCSVRDVALAEYWNYVSGKGGLRAERETGLQFQRDLKVMCEALLEADPTAGIYIFDLPAPDDKKRERELGMTLHTIAIIPMAEEHRVEGKTILEWVSEALEGKTSCVGLSLLDQ